MNTSTAIRKENGQFQPGYSGNPGGRPKDGHKVAELARSYTVEAVETLVDPETIKVRGTASQALLDRGWGRLRWKWLPVVERRISRLCRRQLR